ncbi:ZIP family metal transporter [bacterium]|nr:ZIP family metal transporter [bacterium]
MKEWFVSLNPIWQATLAACLNWFFTTLGASVVFAFKDLKRKSLDLMLGFASGVMLSASFWSLLLPSIEIAKEQGLPQWLPASLGLLFGWFFMRGFDFLIPHLHIGAPPGSEEGKVTTWHRTLLLVSAVTLHNFPEGIIVGVVFAASALEPSYTSLSSALMLALGIGIQDFPEGMAISIPLRKEGLSRFKSFWYGQLSGIVEPLGAMFTIVGVVAAKKLLPYVMGFSAGAMLSVILEDLVPEFHSEANAHLAMFGLFLGFILMMIMDLSF